MRTEFVDDELWSVVAPLIPPSPARRRGGRPWTSDRRVLDGIVYVLLTGVAWRHLPRELGCGSGVTCWRRLNAWQQAGVWSRMHQVILKRLRQTGVLNLYRAIVDSSSVRAVKGGNSRGRIPRIAGKEAANTIFWSTPVGFRSWLASPEPTSRMSSRSNTSSATSHTSADAEGRRRTNRTASTRTKVTRRRRTDGSSPKSE